MTTKARKPPKPTNVCVDADVSLPLVRAKAKQPTCAADLTDGQVLMLACFWARAHGGHPADLCDTLYGFRSSEEDRRHILWVISLNAGWADSLQSDRIGAHNWYCRQHERGEYPVLCQPRRRGEPGWASVERFGVLKG